MSDIPWPKTLDVSPDVFDLLAKGKAGTDTVRGCEDPVTLLQALTLEEGAGNRTGRLKAIRGRLDTLGYPADAVLVWCPMCQRSQVPASPVEGGWLMLDHDCGADNEEGGGLCPSSGWYRVGAEVMDVNAYRRLLPTLRGKPAPVDGRPSGYTRAFGNTVPATVMHDITRGLLAVQRAEYEDGGADG